MYEVTFSQVSNESAQRTLAAEQARGGLSLDEVTALCAEHGVSATLLDAAGFTKGYVKADGSYVLS